MAPFAAGLLRDGRGRGLERLERQERWVSRAGAAEHVSLREGRRLGRGLQGRPPRCSRWRRRPRHGGGGRDLEGHEIIIQFIY